MLAVATQPDQRWRICTLELDAPDRPYAVDTVARMQTKIGATRRLFFMLGADSWLEITAWHEWQRLLQMCDLIVVSRPGYDLSGSTPAGVANVLDVRGMDQQELSRLLKTESGPRVFLTDAVMVNVSATAIRAAVRSDDTKKLREMVPPPVANYIEKYELYQK
jgi:nicotinate-nucleotide adenylyltransferase